jgi:glycerophosphoryl diester phosphodiesterase
MEHHQSSGCRKVAIAAGLLLLGSAACQKPPSPWDLQGHRGARGLQPENTIPSFLKALEYGVDTIELDLAVSADGRLIVSHEPWMNSEICRDPAGNVIEGDGRPFNLYRMTADSIATYDCGSWGHPRFPQQVPMAVHKPVLDEAIAAIEAEAERIGLKPLRYNIETKIQPGWEGEYTPQPDDFARLVHEVVVNSGIRGRAILQSFDERTLIAMKAIDPDMPLALLVENTAGLAANLARLPFKPDIYSPYHLFVHQGLRDSTREMGISLIPWTVNHTSDMRRLLDLGVDGIITDYPDSARILRNP